MYCLLARLSELYHLSISTLALCQGTLVGVELVTIHDARRLCPKHSFQIFKRMALLKYGANTTLSHPNLVSLVLTLGRTHSRVVPLFLNLLSSNPSLMSKYSHIIIQYMIFNDMFYNTLSLFLLGFSLVDCSTAAAQDSQTSFDSSTDRQTLSPIHKNLQLEAHHLV